MSEYPTSSASYIFNKTVNAEETNQVCTGATLNKRSGCSLLFDIVQFTSLSSMVIYFIWVLLSCANSITPRICEPHKIFKTFLVFILCICSSLQMCRSAFQLEYPFHCIFHVEMKDSVNSGENINLGDYFKMYFICVGVGGNL